MSMFLAVLSSWLLTLIWPFCNDKDNDKDSNYLSLITRNYSECFYKHLCSLSQLFYDVGAIIISIYRWGIWGTD